MPDENAAVKRRIFISYRRADNPDFVERIRDWFAWKYGRDSVFMDFDTIPPFTPFADFIHDQVRECDVLVAIIGPEWMRLLRERLQQQDDEDYVRTEIKLALELKKPVAPVCIKQAPMPNPRDLPPDLRPMLDYNSAQLDSGRHFLDNIEMILEAVETQLARLDAWKVMAHVQTVQFDVMKAIEQYQAAADQSDWKTALGWLHRIRQSGFAPDYYPLDDYEREAQEALRLQSAAANYQFIRLMAERALKKPEERTRVWSALEAFWRDFPAYDPDDLVARFRPLPEIIALSETTLDPITMIATATVSSPRSFDVSLLDQLDNLHDSDSHDLFDPDKLAAIAEKLGMAENTIPLEQAEEAGIVDWQE
jgi:TIR domain